jgi:hypothetical protein
VVYATLEGLMRCFLAIAMMLTIACVRAEQQAAVDVDSIKTKIAVVKTWKELRAQPEIHIGGGVTVRLGVETLRCPRLSGVMIYCVAENYDQAWQAPDPDEQLGPVQIRIEARGALKAMVAKAVQKIEKDSLKARRILFAQILPIAGKGIYDVLVLDQNKEPLATCAIEATDESAPVWSLLQQNNEALQELQSADETPVIHLRYDGTAAAVPKIEGWTPLRWESSTGEREPAPFGDDDPLPNLQFPDEPKDPPPPAELAARVRALLPKLGSDDFDTREAAMRELEKLGKPARPLIAAEAKANSDTELRARARQLSEKIDGEFTAKLLGHDFLLTLTEGIETAWVENNVLARWWVNGKPFQPGPLEALQQEGGLGGSRRVDSLLLKVKLDAAKLGAKSGDKIAVQFLHCPMGYQLVDEQKMEMLARAIREATDNFPRVSNKIEFTLP